MATAATWTFVESGTYTLVTVVVSLVAIVALALAVFREELSYAAGAAPKPIYRQPIKAAVAPLLLCFAVVSTLRIIDIAYPQPKINRSGGSGTNVARALPTAYRSYFAGGVSSLSEQAFLDLLNPTAHAARVELAFFFDNGASDTKTLSVPPASERVVPVASLEKSMGSFGLRVAASQQIAAQLRLSRAGKDGGVLSAGNLSTTWYLAEGSTNLTFHESVAVLNPDPNQAAQVVLRLAPQSGDAGSFLPETVAPHSQLLIDVNMLAPGLELGMEVTADRPVAVSRTLTFGRNAYGMTTQTATTAAERTWNVAQGTTIQPIESYLLVLNPGGDAAHVTARFYGAKGKLLGQRTVVAGAARRATLLLKDSVSAARFGSVIESDRPVVVEQAEYSCEPNASKCAGSDLMGSAVPAARWMFAGGDTRGSETIQLYNPGNRQLTVDAKFYGTDGSTAAKKVVVGPHSLRDIDVNHLLPNFAPQHGLVLQSTDGRGFFAQQTDSTPEFGTQRST